MGIYLSHPSTEIVVEGGKGNEQSFFAGEMQGWRKNMEDAHIAVAKIEYNDKSSNKISLYGVFDGHGGSIVFYFIYKHYIYIYIYIFLDHLLFF
jgi:protein phosphatase 1G